MAVDYGSGSIRINGLGSDVDFDDMVSKLYKIESRHVQQLLRWKSDWDQRRAAFKQLRDEMLSFRSALGNINTIDKFLVKNAHTSNAAVVSATPSANAQEGSYKVEVNRLATVASWSFDTSITDKSASINDSTTPGEFVYSYKGKQFRVPIPKGTTLDGLKNIINNNSGQSGVKATLIQSTDGYVFQLRGMDTGKEAVLTVDSVVGVQDMSFSTPFSWVDAGGGQFVLDKSFSSYTTSINETGRTQTFDYSHNGVNHTVDIADGASLLDVANAINEKTPGAAEIYQAGGKYYLSMRPAPATVSNKSTELNALEGTVLANNNAIIPAGTYSFDLEDGSTYTFTADGASHTVQNLVDDMNTLHPGAARLNPEGGSQVSLEVKFTTDLVATPATTGSFGTLDWRVSRAQDAQVRIDGWPENSWLETSTNTIDDVVEGVTFNLRAEGEAIVNVSINSEEIIKNVQKFVEATNALRKTIQDLTKLDESKEVIDQKYAKSLFEMQKGSILTGNYGVQLISSRLKQATSATAVGFTPRTVGGSIISGDIYSSLSQIGILTNAEESSPNYGLLEFFDEANKTGVISLETALRNNPRAVAELFAASGLVTTESTYFGHNSHVASLTKPGSYQVEYDILPDGTIDPTTAKINGKKAVVYQDTKQIGLSSSENPPNAADGLFLDIYDLNYTGTTKKGVINIKQGKINELISMLDGEEGMLSPNKGALGILERNYKDISDNIEKKIKTEDERLTKWERTTRLRFARLEGVLKAYNAQNDALKEQLKQLSQK